jgi:hypothetical protein
MIFCECCDLTALLPLTYKSKPQCFGYLTSDGEQWLGRAWPITALSYVWDKLLMRVELLKAEKDSPTGIFISHTSIPHMFPSLGSLE